MVIKYFSIERLVVKEFEKKRRKNVENFLTPQPMHLSIITPPIIGKQNFNFFDLKGYGNEEKCNIYLSGGKLSLILKKFLAWFNIRILRRNRRFFFRFCPNWS